MVLMGEAADALPRLVLQPKAQTCLQRRALAGSGLFAFCQQQVTHIGGCFHVGTPIGDTNMSLAASA